ncbi:MAG TPA: hypothetical protein VK735_15450 [Pseudonocardia sp.]|uniref:thermonuclease family protein n=1 Tax=Pseudonocardia sp. TaxID=60912 RepID=UPI002CE3F8DB|nr:hypothetical protein [Pseudonocardia sp.]HTF48840.1 hypothetical protein [Pseudonocardia sp.]
MARKAFALTAIAAAIGTLLVFTPAASAAPAAVGEVAVAEIIDGDTFITADGTKIRPLGIDSCEMGTPGGQQAKEDAAIWLNGTVVLRTEPGVDLDVHGRSLRYVEVLGGIDFGGLMVTYDHTGVYQGKLAPKYSANPAYLAELRAQDSEGRTCAGTASTGPPVIVNRDGDDDHRESRWCRKRKFPC